MQQQDDKRAERCIATEMIAQDCSHCRGSFARLVGGHSALSGREHTGPLAHKAAVIFYNVTRQNPWQEGGRRRLVGRCYRPINVFKSKKLASPARCPYWQALDNETVVGSAKRLPFSLHPPALCLFWNRQNIKILEDFLFFGEKFWAASGDCGLFSRDSSDFRFLKFTNFFLLLPLGKTSMEKKRFLSGPSPLTPIQATWSFFSDVKIQDLKVTVGRGGRYINNLKNS